MKRRQLHDVINDLLPYVEPGSSLQVTLVNWRDVVMFCAPEDTERFSKCWNFVGSLLSESRQDMTDVATVAAIWNGTDGATVTEG